jgi:hypothetical protein
VKSYPIAIAAFALFAGATLGAAPGYAQTISPTTAPTMPAVPPDPVAAAPLPPQGQQALENNPSGTVTKWKNPDGVAAEIVPQPAFQTSDGKICREFQQTVTIAGKPQQAYGTACRQPDGSWKLQPAPQVAAAPPPSVVTPQPQVVYPAPAPVVYGYPYYPPGYYYPRPYYSSSIFIGVGGGHRRHW